MQAVHAKHRQGGFTLTELLVASAIFMILMSALAAMFNAAVSSVRQGYASIDLFETGRQAMTVLGRDLGSGFTAREYGDNYNFYGRPNGFMFVGALDSGQLGRVTYAFHPEATDFVYTTITERWKTVEANVRRQIERVAREYGYTGTARRDAADEAIARIELAYGGPFLDTDYVEFDVRLRTESLIRYEESGVSDLDTYNMTIDSTGTTVLEWPYMDMADSNNDAAPASLDGNPQLEFIRGALSPDPATTNSPSDLRNRLYDINVNLQGVPLANGDRTYLRVLGPQTFQQLVNARKREFWVRMLSGDQSMGVPSLAKDTNPAAQNGCWGFWYNEEYGAVNGNARHRRILNEYVIARGVVGAAEVLEKGSTDPVQMFDGRPPLLYAVETLRPIPDTPIDVLDADVRFAYGDGSNGSANYFNALDNLGDLDNPYRLDNLYALVNNGTGAIANADLIEADNALADDLLGNRSSRSNMGSPLAPRIPALVTADFWVTRTRTRPGAPDMLKHFSQTVQIPTAQGRSVSSTIAQGPGASL